MNNNLRNIRFKQKVWLETPDGENIFGDGKYQLLKSIEKHGSLKAALEALGLSYRKTWDNLKRIEKTLGFPILETQQGGSDGGSTTLTPEAYKLLQAFELFHTQYDQIFLEITNKLEKDIFESL
jgi:molybdate transport system regulatory protein